MLEHACKIAVDPIFPPPAFPAAKRNAIPDIQDNKFESIYSDIKDQPELKALPIDDNMIGIIQEEELEDDSQEDQDEEF